MQTESTFDIAVFLQNLKFTPFHRRILFLSCVVTFFDGMDFLLMAFTLPYIRDDMNLTREVMGNVSAAAFLGQMIGSLLGSYIADLIGRRPVILICTVLSAILTFVTGFAHTPDLLIVARFVGGLAVGGLLAPAWSLNIEAMPKSMRATSVTIVMLGFSVGSSVAGPITNFLAPGFGWPMVYFFCGVVTMLLAVLLYFTLPESMRWMAAKGKPAAQIAPLVRRFDPAIDTSRYSAFIVSDESRVGAKQDPLAKFIALFRGPLSFITPLIWAAYFCSSFVMFLKSAYSVLFLETLGISVVNASWINSAGGLLGALGGVVLLMFTEKRGPLWIMVAPLIGIPTLLLIGSGLVDQTSVFVPVILLAMIMIGAGHSAIISMTSIYYPSTVRATGGGCASFMAKFASVAAPLVGARYFLGDRMAVLDGYLFSAAGLAGAIACIVLLAHFAKRLSGNSAQPTTITREQTA